MGLLDEIEARASEIGATHLALDTSEPAHDLIAPYAARGCEIVERHDRDGTNYESVVMSKVFPTTPA